MLDRPVAQVVLYEDRLYLNEGDGRLSAVELPDALPTARPFEAGIERGAVLRLARMDEHLIVAQDGVGVRVLALPSPHAHHGDRPPAHDVRSVGLLEIEREFTAVAGSSRRIFAAAATGELFVIDAGRPDEPKLERTLFPGVKIEALAANGLRLYALGAGALTVLDLSKPLAATIERQQGIRGRAVAVAGRAVHVAGETVVSYLDRTVEMTTHPVTVSSNIFTPSNFSIAPGDTVEWTNVAGFHNVESCDGVSDPGGCGGTAVEGLFTSGSAAFPPWTFSHTFNLVGDNPYFCVVHIAANMFGNVTVAAPAVPPPGTPDGSAGTTPLRVAKAPFGLFPNRLALTWDVTTCTDAGDYQLLFGAQDDLPSTFAGSYGLNGALCSIGTTGGASWNIPPSPAQGDFTWFLVVANDDVSEEGPWGQNSGSVERTGPGPGGSSNSCNSIKNLSNVCGQ